MKSVELVCIIDDDKIYRFTTEKYIHMLKLASRVLSYSDGEEALDFLKQNTYREENLPDIIFLDVNMPIMDGWDFLEEYRELAPRLPKRITIYMVSSSIDIRDRERAQQITDISDFIVKPITEEQLITLVQKAVA